MKPMFSRRPFTRTSSVIRLLAGIALGCMPITSAMAETATALVNVTARYSGQTCYFDSSSQTIDFGVVSATLFNSVGVTPSETVRNLTVKAYCQDVGIGTWTNFEATADGADSSLVKNTGSATGIGIALTYTDSGSGVLNNPYLTLGLSSSWTAINLSAALRRTSATFQAGTVNATVVVKLNYF
ncbi:fimbrial protein [Serratia quinivorans]|uniref:fimbrial protein n=1 Tax=Serratia quinivorans TaxID=137545 RepID=UPI00217A339E|nr:fimbrial protein [Serratia quinivorans]CAI1073277.1 P pilus assembly protein, pilin FimA [Serratia quinivorans]